MKPSQRHVSSSRPLCSLEILYDGREEATEDLEARAEQTETKRVELRRRLNVPPAPADLAEMGSLYSNPALGQLAVEKKGATVRVRVTAPELEF